MRKRALLFSGQGAQQVGMGRDLVALPEIADIYRDADTILGFKLSEISFNGPEEQLTTTAVCQPALYVHGYALLLAAQSRIDGFTFSATAGLSLGEYTAHAAAGTFDFVTGLKLVFERSKLMQRCCEQTDGGMLTLLGADESTAMAVALESKIDVANYNCPGQIVLSGDKAHIPKAVEVAKAKGIRKAIPLKVAGAYHSRLMRAAELGMAGHLDASPIAAPRVPVMANYTGQSNNDPGKIRELLAKQITGSVRWEQCIRSLIESGIEQFIEFGPGGVLAGLLKRIDSTKHCISISTFADLDRQLTELTS